jgi:pimeloyl-ACP methyl ester carboxylesterase
MRIRLGRAAAAGVVLAAAAGAGAGCESQSRGRDRALRLPGELVDVGGYRVRRYEAGSGYPTVVLVPGAGDCADSWLPVRDRVASFARVLSYDRPGLGGSPDGPPPDIERYLAELRQLLHTGADAGPYVLAGHSLGGLIAHLYSQRHPGDVAALVLVDATPDAIADDPGVRAGFMASGAAASVLKASAPLGVLRLLVTTGAMPLYPEQRQFRGLVTDEDYRRWIAGVCRSFSGAAGAELRSVLPTARYAHQQQSAVHQPQFGNLPLGVLTSHAYGDRWVEIHREIATQSRRSSHHITQDRSHNIHMRHPDLVADTIRQVRDEVRNNQNGYRAGEHARETGPTRPA